MKLTSGFEDFGFGKDEDDCVRDAVASGCISLEQIEEGLEHFKRTNVLDILGQGLYFTEDDDQGE